MFSDRTILLGAVGVLGLTMLSGCGAQPVANGSNVSTVNTSAANSTVNTNAASAAAPGVVAAREPEQYQATVTVNVEVIGEKQKSAVPTLAANVARSGNDRRMEFMMPAGGRVIFLDKGGVNYLVLPDRRQYAELNQESLGFEARRILMPEQIVDQAKAMPGVTFVGEEQYKGRAALKYQYGAVADTQTQAGQVATESFLLVDKETGLPLRSETVSQTQTGARIQGFSGIRLVTEIFDINPVPETGIFDAPTGFQKIEASQVKAQVDMIFYSLASFAGQMMGQSQPAQPAASPASSPVR